jgi:hypothetical protein
MSDVSPESVPGDDASSPAPTPDSPVSEPWFAAPTDAPAAQPNSGGVQWAAPPTAGGAASSDPATFQLQARTPATAAFAWPYPMADSTAPQRPWRRIRGPLIGFVAGAVAIGLAWGGYAIASHASVKNNNPVASSSPSRSGGITVTGKGIEMTFPVGWVNVPTSPSQLEQFIQSFTSRYKHVIPASVQSEMDDPELLSSFAMFVFRVNGQGSYTENLNALIPPPGLPSSASQVLAQLKTGQIPNPTVLGATDVEYKLTSYGNYPSVLITYTVHADGITAYVAQAYLEGPKLVIATVSSFAPTGAGDLRRILDTIRFV